MRVKGYHPPESMVKERIKKMEQERLNLLPNDRVFTSRHVFKIKRKTKTGAASMSKARLIIRGLEMQKHVDCDDNFSQTSGTGQNHGFVSSSK